MPTPAGAATRVARPVRGPCRQVGGSVQEQRSKPNVQHPAVQRVSTAELDGKVQCLLPANGAQLPGQPCHRQQVPAARRCHRTPNGGNLGGAPGSCDRADRYRGMSSSLSLGSAAAAWYARLHRRRRRRDGRAGVAGGAVGCRRPVRRQQQLLAGQPAAAYRCSTVAGIHHCFYKADSTVASRTESALHAHLLKRSDRRLPPCRRLPGLAFLRR